MDILHNAPLEEGTRPWRAQARDEASKSHGRTNGGKHEGATSSTRAEETVSEGGHWRCIMDRKIASQYVVGALSEAEMGETGVYHGIIAIDILAPTT